MSTPLQNATQQITSPISKFTLKSLLDSYQTATATSLNCHAIGTIQSFDSSTQTATVTINYTKTYFQYDPAINDTAPTQLNYPKLEMCPVIFLGGGSTALTFPIEQGDECLVLFNDRSLDNWFQSGQVGPLNSPRLHSLSDGIALVGLRSTPNVLENYNSTHAVIRNDAGAQVGVNSTAATILIGNNLTTLNTLLQSLITQLQALTVTGVTSGGSSSGVPTNASAIAAIGVQLGELLE